MNAKTAERTPAGVAGAVVVWACLGIAGVAVLVGNLPETPRERAQAAAEAEQEASQKAQVLAAVTCQLAIRKSVRDAGYTPDFPGWTVPALDQGRFWLATGAVDFAGGAARYYCNVSKDGNTVIAAEIR